MADIKAPLSLVRLAGFADAAALHEAVVTYAHAMVAHLHTVNVPAPEVHELVKALVAREHVSLDRPDIFVIRAYEVIDDRPSVTLLLSQIISAGFADAAALQAELEACAQSQASVLGTKARELVGALVERDPVATDRRDGFVIRAYAVVDDVPKPPVSPEVQLLRDTILGS